MKAFLSSIALWATLLVGCSEHPEQPTELNSLLERGDADSYYAADRKLEALDTRTRNKLLPGLLQSGNPRAVCLGAAHLVRSRLYDEAAPVVVGLLTSPRLDPELTGYLLADWQASPRTWANMMSRVGRELLLNRENYLPEVRQRVDGFLTFGLKLEVNKPFDREQVVASLLQLEREAARGRK